MLLNSGFVTAGRAARGVGNLQHSAGQRKKRRDSILHREYDSIHRRSSGLSDDLPIRTPCTRAQIGLAAVQRLCDTNAAQSAGATGAFEPTSAVQSKARKFLILRKLQCRAGMAELADAADSKSCPRLRTATQYFALFNKINNLERAASQECAALCRKKQLQVPP